MDFLNRSGAPQHQPGVRPASTPHTTPTVVGSGNNGDKKKTDKSGKLQPGWLRIAFVILLFSGTIVAVALVWLLYIGGNNESDRINTKKYQAVFLTNGQVYFGKINNVGTTFLDLQDIYYLNTQNQTSGTKEEDKSKDFALVKLGCELHGPTDQMLINRQQVTFWENLKDDSQVSLAIDKFVKANPDGQKCSTTSNSTDQSTSNNQDSSKTNSSSSNSNNNNSTNNSTTR